MSEFQISTLQTGDSLPVVKLEPITRTTLALYCGASNDHHPMHVDIDFAKRVGLGDVIGHGMLSMAYVGRYASRWVGSGDLRSLQCRFLNSTRVDDVPTLSASVIERWSANGETLLRIQISMTDQYDAIKVQAQAVLSIGDTNDP